MTLDTQCSKAKTTQLVAIEFSKDLTRLSDPCPPEVTNPGLYYGFLAGARYQQHHSTVEIEKLKAKATDLQNTIIMLKSSILSRDAK